MPNKSVNNKNKYKPRNGTFSVTQSQDKKEKHAIGDTLPFKSYGQSSNNKSWIKSQDQRTAADSSFMHGGPPRLLNVQSNDNLQSDQMMAQLIPTSPIGNLQSMKNLHNL